MSGSLDRRQFLNLSAGLAAGAMLSGAALGKGSEIPTPAQTSGPFYPVPGIAQQPVNDIDMTRKGENDPVAKGELITVKGRVLGLDGEPLSGALVQVWQACESGRYNHTRDRNTAPLDPNFQYWAQMTAGEEGEFLFHTIKPGKYPGRTPHIHLYAKSGERPTVVTQMYFAEYGEANQKDFIYRSLNRKQKELVTVGFAKTTDSPERPVGNLDLYLSPVKDGKGTPEM